MGKFEQLKTVVYILTEKKEHFKQRCKYNN